MLKQKEKAIKHACTCMYICKHMESECNLYWFGDVCVALHEYWYVEIEYDSSFNLVGKKLCSFIFCLSLSQERMCTF